MVTKTCQLVAEIGAVHAGSLKRAIDLVRLARENGADVVKFQKRNPVDCVPTDLADQPHPNPYFSYGKTYLDHRMALELDIESHGKIKNECDSIGIPYACSVWDLKSAKDILHIDPFFIKIPSACNMNYQLIDYCINNFNGHVHISLGMLSGEERHNVINRYKSEKVIFYHTTTEYPCPFERLYLREISNIMKECGVAGFSNHGYGIAADIAALTLGVSFIERHFIDDRTFRHTDAAASLEPQGLKILKRDILNVEQALAFRSNFATEEENKQAKKLRNSSK